MKTTLEIPDELYRQAKVLAARENSKIEDLVTEGLRLFLERGKKTQSHHLRRMTKAPVIVRSGNVIPALSNDAMAKLLGCSTSVGVDLRSEARRTRIP